jgi:hypothetical protein
LRNESTEVVFEKRRFEDVALGHFCFLRLALVQNLSPVHAYFRVSGRSANKFFGTVNCCEIAEASPIGQAHKERISECARVQFEIEDRVRR